MGQIFPDLIQSVVHNFPRMQILHYRTTNCIYLRLIFSDLMP